MKTKLIKALLKGRTKQMKTARKLKRIEQGAVEGFPLYKGGRSVGEFYPGGHTVTQMKQSAVKKARELNKKLVRSK